MAEPEMGESQKGKQMHYSVGAVIEKEGKYLLIDRRKKPLGFACPAGHIDKGESPLNALFREVKEETSLDVLTAQLIFEEEVDNNVCSRGVGVHYWYVYKCTAKGEIHMDPEEAKKIGWYLPHDIRGLELEPVWNYWLKKLEVI